MTAKRRRQRRISKKIALLRREGYPAKQAAAIAYRKERARRNPVHHKHGGKKKVQWKWILGGGAVGGIATTGYTMTLPSPVPQTYIDNGVAGLGGGMILGGILGGLINKSFGTGAFGIFGGAALIGLGLLTSPTPTNTGA